MGLCASCQGTGTVRTGRYRVSGSYKSYEEATCTRCGGSGQTWSPPQPQAGTTPDRPRTRSGGSGLTGFVLFFAGVGVWAWMSNLPREGGIGENPPTAQAVPSPAANLGDSSRPPAASPAETASPAVPPADPPPPDPVPAMVALPDGLTPAQFNIARLSDLSFYPSTQLWEFGRLGTDTLAAYLVPSEGAPIRLDGKVQAIHDHNSRVHLSLTEEAVAADYLRFFMAFVWSEEGSFRTIETPADVPLPARQDPNVVPSPLRLGQLEDAFETTVVVLYSTALWKARLRVERDGMVKMLDDEPVFVKLPRDEVFDVKRGQRRPATVVGLAGNQWPLPPPVPGNWRNATSEEVVRVRQLILDDSAR